MTLGFYTELGTDLTEKGFAFQACEYKDFHLRGISRAYKNKILFGFDSKKSAGNRLILVKAPVLVPFMF
jgi:hypothetical protein